MLRQLIDRLPDSRYSITIRANTLLDYQAVIKVTRKLHNDSDKPDRTISTGISLDATIEEIVLLVDELVNKIKS